MDLKDYEVTGTIVLITTIYLLVRHGLDRRVGSGVQWQIPLKDGGFAPTAIHRHYATYGR